ncbi:MAG: glycosyltransferase [Deltaproteobacteria bacterium]|nr:glycosyltransferase [Deltaproteobacteria bacterium]
MRIAIVHDWLTGMRGGERCLEVFCELFPEADLFTLLHVKGSVSPKIEAMKIRTSFVQNLPFSRKGYRSYLPLFPLAVESFDLKGYDLVLSSSHCVAKGVIPPPDCCHISYVYSPMRYVWDMYFDYFGNPRGRRAGRPVLALFAHYLRAWDVTSSERVDHFIAISRHVARRIKKYYRRDSKIIHPPVDTRRFRVSKGSDDFYLIVSALAPYKGIDLAVQAFNRLGYPLKLIGSGQDEKRLRAMARPNIEFLGWQPDDVVAEHYSRCKALVFPGEEDFGITPLEAQASGRPVIAYGRGGVLETVVPLSDRQIEGRDVEAREGPDRPGSLATGVFFYEQSVESLIRAVRVFEEKADLFHGKALRRHAMKWDRSVFKRNFRDAVSDILRSWS